jgi:hypothetical protein
MTPEEEKLVLRWLRLRPKHPRHGLRERRMLQTAILNDYLSRDIRDAMADWLEDDPASLLPGRSKPYWHNDLPYEEHLRDNDRQLEELAKPKPALEE